MAREHDIVVFGATGFCARQVLAYLAPAIAGTGLGWALAARNPVALEKLAASIAHGPPPATIVADARDVTSLLRMTERSRVILNLAGPYEINGAHDLVRACIATGTDYLDLAAETSLHRRLIDDFHESARAAGRRIVPACGFLSVPFDLGIFRASELLAAAHGSALAAADVVVRYLPRTRWLTPGNAFSSGTVATLADVVRRGRVEGLTDPWFLTPGAERSKRTGEEAIRIDRWVDLESGAICVSMFPTPFINPQIVHRSRALLRGADASADAPHLAYVEGVDVESLFPDPLLRSAAALQFDAYHRLLRGFLERRSGLAASASRALLGSLGVRTGGGPSDEALDSLDYAIEIRARAVSGRRLTLQVQGRGHPGYRSSANIVAECALMLAGAGSALPQAYGVLTPATAFGSAAFEPLARAGLRFIASGADTVTRFENGAK